MQLNVLGGVGEHGRNCFLLKGEAYNILLDCGMKEFSSSPYPTIEKEELKRTKYLFLSHSHLDHTGAFEFFKQNGFDGFVVATSETLAFIEYDREKCICLDKYLLTKKAFSVGDLLVQTGRSGHCFGGVWLWILFEKTRVLYSGDYTENSLFAVDKIRGMSADIAILDCAYYGEQEGRTDDFIAEMKEKIKKSNVVLPLPKNGRGSEVKWLLLKEKIPFEETQELFVGERPRLWFRHDFPPYEERESEYKVYLLPDGQLKRESSLSLIRQKDAYTLFTGNVDEGGNADQILKGGNAGFVRITVHSDETGVAKLKRGNLLKRVILFHSEKIGKN